MLDANQTLRSDTLEDLPCGQEADPEAVFSEFVRNANAVGLHARTLKFEMPGGEEPDEAPAEQPERSPPGGSDTQPARREADDTRRIRPDRARKDRRGADPNTNAHDDETGASTEPVPLTQRKTTVPDEEMTRDSAARVAELARRSRPGSVTQRVETLYYVPDVANITPPQPPVPERSEDGHIPAGELDRILGDMGVLLRYGHRVDVRSHLDSLLARYPEDLLLRRRVAEFYIEAEDYEPAKECLFKLSAALFERRNVKGMREALQQVLVIDPDNRRAARLLALLDKRQPADDTAAN